MSLKDAASYVFLAVIWGLSFIVLLHVVDAFGWVGAVSLRAMVAGSTLYVIARLTGQDVRFKGGLLPLAAVGATTVAGQLLGLAFAAPRIGTAMTAIIVGTIPMFSMLISQLWGLERITRQGLAGLLAGIAGVVLLVGFPKAPVTPAFMLGCVTAFLGAFSAAFGSNYASRRLKLSGTWEVATGSFLAAGVLTLPLLALVPPPRAPEPVDFLYLAFFGCVMSALAYLLYFRLVNRIGPTRAISVEFGVTVVAVAAGELLLGERLSLLQILGGAIIVAGCALVLGLLPQRVRAVAEPG